MPDIALQPEQIREYICANPLGKKMLAYCDTLNPQDCCACGNEQDVGVIGSVPLPAELALPRLNARFRIGSTEPLCVTHIAYLVTREKSDDFMRLRMLLGNGKQKIIDGKRQYLSEALFTKYGLEELAGGVFSSDEVRSISQEMLLPSAYFLQKVNEAYAALSK